MKSGRRQVSGLSLSELFVAMLIMALLAGGISRLLVSSYDSEATIRNQNAMQRTAQRAADTVVDSLRAATEIASGDQSQLSAVFKNGDRITYYLDDRTLACDTTYGGVTHPGQVIADHMSAMSFRYYVVIDGDWIEADTPASARAVEVSISLSDGKAGATEASAVQLRNKL